MITVIRSTKHSDLEEIMSIYEFARKFMQLSGNTNQWTDGYPSEEFIVSEINTGHSFVCINHEGDIVGTFCFIIGKDPTYSEIYDGEWLNDDPYGTVHRIASAGKEKGVADACFEWCFRQIGNVRVDTHRDNKVMQRIIERFNFTYCGIIYLKNGSERLAYQKVIN